MNKHIYIAGAHSRARTLKVYLSCLYPELQIEAFLTDDMSENEPEIDGIPVLLIEEGLNREYPVYIGTRSVNHKKMTEELQAAGVRNIIPVTPDLDTQLRYQYVKKVYREIGKQFSLIDEYGAKEVPVTTPNNKTGRLYVASSIYDTPLQSDYKLSPDEIVIQAGAALTDRRIGKEALIDCEGENISIRNRQYCELTVLYWIWKHAKEDYVGLVHYRRHFLLPPDWMERMKQNRIDVILPVPLCVTPNLEENYKSRHLPSDWEYLMKYFEVHLPDEYESARKIFQGNLYSPCNMFVMCRKALDDLCVWIFPILDAVAEHGGEKEDRYMNRYPGFLSERLITYFFESRKHKYKVVYANKNFLM